MLRLRPAHLITGKVQLTYAAWLWWRAAASAPPDRNNAARTSPSRAGRGPRCRGAPHQPADLQPCGQAARRTARRTANRQPPVQSGSAGSAYQLASLLLLAGLAAAIRSGRKGLNCSGEWPEWPGPEEGSVSNLRLEVGLPNLGVGRCRPVSAGVTRAGPHRCRRGCLLGLLAASCPVPDLPPLSSPGACDRDAIVWSPGGVRGGRDPAGTWRGLGTRAQDCPDAANRVTEPREPRPPPRPAPAPRPRSRSVKTAPPLYSGRGVVRDCPCKKRSVRRGLCIRRRGVAPPGVALARLPSLAGAGGRRYGGGSAALECTHCPSGVR